MVVTDRRNSTKSGKYLEVLGSYDPRKKNEVFKGDRIKEWMSKGAKLSPTLHNLLINHNIIEGKKINVLPKKRPTKKEPTTNNLSRFPEGNRGSSIHDSTESGSGQPTKEEENELVHPAEAEQAAPSTELGAGDQSAQTSELVQSAGQPTTEESRGIEALADEATLAAETPAQSEVTPEDKS